MKKNKNKSNKFFVISVIILLLVFSIVVLSIAIKYKDVNNSSSQSMNNSTVSKVVSEETPDSDTNSDVSDESSQIDDDSSDIESSEPVSTASQSDESKNTTSKTDEWQLIIANSDNIVTDYYVDLSVIPSEFCQDGIDFEIDSRAYDDLVDMLNAAEEDGVHLNVLSSYRSYEYQNTLYQNKVSYYLNMGYEQKEAETAAATVVAVPGTSDHNLGLACDFNYLEQEFENTDELVWLKENAERFGFVMRYPKGKETVTKIIYEPWHYRYVGTEHAKKMNELNMCLEEYVDYLKNNG
ncbi:MAG: M15 family metallopeptidase [Acutalibacteraceae bacterium]|nr:M15 family metallopeptidase [Acutalibacteraceae bacterium]